ncbi:hypothetical protein BJ170DRAFT_682494 [Xylariales sp. AK1849]|nr:hypothetical protein BJ170DRAFT_682494 [Xylariales sp. AK1849]
MASTSKDSGSAADPKEKGKEVETISTEEAPLKCVHYLSLLDQAVLRRPVHQMYIFDFPDASQPNIDAAVAAIRQGLEIALKHYPFLTGKVGPGDREKNTLQLRYGNTPELRSVTPEIFAVACHEKNTFWTYEDLCKKGMPTAQWPQADWCNMPEFLDKDGWSQAFTLQANFLPNSPAFMRNSLAAGALVLCFGWHACVADGSSMLMFLEEFAAGIRGDINVEDVEEYESSDIEGLFDVDTSMLDEPNKEDFPEWDFDENHLMPSRRHWKSWILTVPNKQVASWKNEINDYIETESAAKDISVSTIDCLSAIMWVYITRARYRSLDWETSTTLFTTVVDIRDRFPPELMKATQFGNNSITLGFNRDVYEILPEMTSHLHLPHAGIAEIATTAMRIRVGIRDSVDEDYIDTRLSILAKLPQPHKAYLAMERALNPTQTGVKLYSLIHYGADIDFGIPGTGGEDGRPRWCRKPWMYDEGAVHVLPRRGGTKGDADWEIMVCLPQNIMTKLLDVDEFGAYVIRYCNDDAEKRQFFRDTWKLRLMKMPMSLHILAKPWEKRANMGL